MRPEIFLFVGPSGAGKDTVAERISLLTGGEIVSLSSQVRKEAAKAGLKFPSRGDLQIFANEMRNLHGNDVFAKLAASDMANSDQKMLIVNGVRHPKEIAAFEKSTVIGVNASRETRFHRVLVRDRPSDPKSWEEFLICDERENGTLDGESGQQNYQCLAKADVVLNNESNSLEPLEYVVDQLVDRLLRAGSLQGVGEIDIFGSDPGPKMLVVTNGPHGAGKTTVGKIVSEKLSSQHVGEIGGKLRKEVDYNALQSSINFDREVMRRELLRDHELLHDKRENSFVLETWHTGNIAYALQRSPELAQSYIGELRKQLLRFEVLHLFFKIDDRNFFERATENVGSGEKRKLLNFYKQITKYTKQLYKDLNLNFAEVDNNGSIEVAAAQAFKLASAHIG